MNQRIVGLDIGAETCKLVELNHTSDGYQWVRKALQLHHKQPLKVAMEMLQSIDFNQVSFAAVTGRGSRGLALERIPLKAAASRGMTFLYPKLEQATLISIGSHGFYLLERHGQGREIIRENARCSQGTGNFLQQLVERFGLTVEQASAMTADVSNPAPLSGRCPVILKTDMTHLANQGENQERILAGLYDAVCENVQVLIKPNSSPKDVILTGGVSLSPRIRKHFESFLSQHGMVLHEGQTDDRFVEALGAALIAAENQFHAAPLDALVQNLPDLSFERLPPLSAYRDQIVRLKAPKPQIPDVPTEVVLGVDIGSTGSKAVAFAIKERKAVWESYMDTCGKPIDAAQTLVSRFIKDSRGLLQVKAIGTTGSGREIVGSLMASCFGPDRIFILNEIAAHGEGALFFDAQVDTIFEIGGQDAKYIRLEDGRICDAAMNEACSAGTGSFIAEQGQKFEGVSDVIQMGQIAMKAEEGISLGQHCSVFMAEIIDDAVAAGLKTETIIAGIYDSIIQNYLNRVKGNRSVGKRIFCQGMPFSSDALAAAVIRQTGSAVVVPPNPGTIGALGIALLTIKNLDLNAELLDLTQFLKAKVIQKDCFICQANKGCGGSGNHCRIERLKTAVGDQQKVFLWGGSCSLYDQGVKSRKLEHDAPNPFREREDLLQSLLQPCLTERGAKKIALCNEFGTKALLPFFSVFFYELGFDLSLFEGRTHDVLKKGIEVASIPFCAPLQLYHGVLTEIAQAAPDYVFLPMLRSLPRCKDETSSTTCPMVQASPDLVASQFAWDPKTTLLSPRIDMGAEDLSSEIFKKSCGDLAAQLGVSEWQTAYEKALAAYLQFTSRCLEIGQNALDYAREHHKFAVIVLGRAYTIYNPILNSNIPNLLREQGALAIPVDCYPVSDDMPVFRDIYWGYSQINLRAAHQIRRREGEYDIFASNYSCGPDSFNLHFFSYMMKGKPFGIIETDGHAGDAGTKTRLEAFLYCVAEDQRLTQAERQARYRTNFKAIEAQKIDLLDARIRDEVVEIPPMGVGSPAAAAVLRADGVRAEVLPLPDRETLYLGRKYTSGKECIPLTLTMGAMLQRIQNEPNPDERFAFYMPTADGPCRFGVYNLLHKIVFEQLGLKDRIQIIAPMDTDYFAGMPADLELRLWVAFVACDYLLAALHDTRPVELIPGEAQRIFDRYYAQLIQKFESTPGGSLIHALGELGGSLFGIRQILLDAAAEFAKVKDFTKLLPTVSLVGEIYCRLDPFANDFVVDKLESRGLKVHMAPFSEWLEYTNHLQKMRVAIGQPREGDAAATIHVTSAIMSSVMDDVYSIFSRALKWPVRMTVKDAIAASEPYLSEDLVGEAVLTVGGPLFEFAHGVIHGVCSVGPHECMPSKVAEAQFCHVTDELPVLHVPLTGDGLNREALDAFAFEVKRQFHSQHDSHKRAHRIAVMETPDRTSVPHWADRLGNQVASVALKAIHQVGNLSNLFKKEEENRPQEKHSQLPGTGPGKVGLRWPPAEGSVPRV